MITSLKLENFRGFTALKISPIKRINLIAGANNTGKTGILEGLYLMLASENSQIPQLPYTFRSNTSGQPNQYIQDDFATFWQALFYDKNTSVEAKISAQTDSEQIISLGLKTVSDGSIQFDYGPVHGNPSPPPSGSQRGPRFGGGNPAAFRIAPQGVVTHGHNPFGTKFIVLSTRLEHPTRDAELFNQVSILGGGEEKLISLLREIDPRLQKLRYLKAPGTQQPLVYAHFGLRNALSMTQTGQGFSKLFSLFCQMLVANARVLLIDEIENGLYYESLPTIWRGIAALAASENIQVFATTHSRECIVAAHEVFSGTPDYDFALHRLQRVKGSLEVVTHDQQMLNVAIKSGLEVR
jgi:hypothetical protein